MALQVKVYRFAPTQVLDMTGTGYMAGLTTALANDSVDENSCKFVDVEVIRGEVVVTVLHT
tara:strand:+ start:382 stop:564 length:183 start_codon:yes stop_codon:yes gene_type:complete